jgi:hypothetical protein
VPPPAILRIGPAWIAKVAQERNRTMKIAKIRSSKERARREAAQSLAVAALSFLASEPEHLGGFLATTGIGPNEIREASSDPGFLGGVLDYLAGDEALLIAFARQQGIDPAEVERARAALGRVWERDIP